MQRRLLLPLAAVALAAAASAAPPPAATGAGALDLVGRVTRERRVVAADGTVRIVELPATGAAPGDRVTVTLAYRNTGPVPLADLRLANPVPAGLAYRGPVAGVPEPEVSADGRLFAPLARLVVPSSEGGSRAAVPDDVTQVRWRLARPVAPGAGGSLGFRAVVK